MIGNPYLRAQRLQARHRRRAIGVAGALARVGLGLGAAALGALLLERAFLGFLDESGAAVADGLGAVVIRLGLLLTALAALDGYEAVLRGEDRPVLSLLPVEPGAVVAASLVGLAARRWWTTPACAILLVPVLVRAGPMAWTVAVAALLGVQLLAWPVAIATYLIAVDAARSPALAPVLEALRGQNPRELAAFLYAPGAVVVAVAGGLWAASAGVSGALRGEGLALAWLAVAPVLGAGVALALPALGRRAWFRAGTVLSDIDARHAALSARDEAAALHVYLDWAVRFLPLAWRRAALHDLRHGWRGRRVWLSGAWLAGLAAAGVGWTEDPAGPGRAAVVATLGIALVASVVFAMVRDEPEFLRWWLPPGPAPREIVRAVVVLMWSAPTLAFAAVVAAFFAGFSAAGLVVGVGLTAATALAALAVATSRAGRAGPWLYLPAAAGVVLGVAALASGAP
jgi:hypothetical protein